MTAVDPAVLDAVTARAWRAAEEGGLGGWRLNAALGVSGRLNACWPLGPQSLAADVAVAAVEAWYAARGLPAVFKITDGICDPPDLAERLALAGYAPGPETLVMTATSALAADDRVSLLEDADERFTAVFQAAAAGPADFEERLGALGRTPRPRAFAVAQWEGRPAAVGACAVEAPWAGIFAMRTAPAFRRRGLAHAVLGSLMAFGRQHGAQIAWLQVEAANTGARRLYERAGFTEAYRYRYWMKTPA